MSLQIRNWLLWRWLHPEPETESLSERARRWSSHKQIFELPAREVKKTDIRITNELDS